MTIFLLLYIVFFILVAKKTNFCVLSNPIYWLLVFWTMIIGIFLTSGILYKYGHSMWVWLYLLLCAFSFYLGLQRGHRTQVGIFPSSKFCFPLKAYCIMGLVGVCMFSFDYIRLNGIATGKGDANISLVGSIGSLFVPILLVLGLYLNARSIKQNGKFNLVGCLLVIGYSIPCMINAGREAILFCIIGMLCLYGYNMKVNKANMQKQNTFALKRFILFFLMATCVFFLAFLVVEISSTRFTDNEINVLLSKHDVSMSTLEEAETWGPFEFLYYNIASYFSHQIPFLDFTLREYDGPYLCGCFELNIISRRLPEFMGLDYNGVYNQLEKLYLLHGESFSGGWNTILGSLISDFAWVGSIFFCFLCGFFVAVAQKKLQLTLDPRYATLVALFCLSTFSTIQLGPFYQTQIYGTYIWWYIFFRKEETKRI